MPPIGVFDSGVGGLSVLRAIRAELPSENLNYFADSANAPYGDRSSSFVQQRAMAITRFLLDQGAKAIVVACNTATGIAVDDLRAMFDVPVVAVEPAVKPAAARTKTGVVGVLTTAGTAASEKLTRLVNKYGADVRIIVQPSPGLADQVEKGELDAEATRTLVATYVQPLVAADADVIVLGCTHYPFIRSVIQESAGPKVALIDPADAVARELRRRLTEAGLAEAWSGGGGGTERFWTTGDPETVARIIGTLWGRPVTVTKEQI